MFFFFFLVVQFVTMAGTFLRGPGSRGCVVKFVYLVLKFYLFTAHRFTPGDFQAVIHEV